MRKFSLMSGAVSSLQNGILESDDIYRNGLPASKFSLRDETASSTAADANGDQHTRLVQQLLMQHRLQQASSQSNQQSDDHKTTTTTTTTSVGSEELSAAFAESRHVDPFAIVQRDLSSISHSIRQVIGSDHPVLETIAKYFFDTQGKRFRPTLVLLCSRAASLTPVESTGEPTLPMAVRESDGSSLLETQQRLSEITELIHTASLLHDDVIDDAETRRGVKSINAVFGNKLAILGGDFLLARASVSLARLRSLEVVEIMSIVIENLVKGEVMQLKPSSSATLFDNVDTYLSKSYYKTASLMANSCRSAAILGGHDALAAEICYEYGKYIGLAFQIVDDLLDFEGSSDSLGKPSLNDISHGIATLPVLLASEQYPELLDMMERKFKGSTDVETAIWYVQRSNAIERARTLATACAENAVAAAQQLPDSDYKHAMITLVERVINRSH
eukprot:TRINITY_DN68176_c1_g1_i12.p1 TRINITY_DN68176_c1_g1~~TRINITY_DN68176_c1_g1_i12.p1  ORF type:complete len:481 (+),score=271.05 TRINITY_DN68176_c1_g1_i12:107-1444(+)